MFADLRCQRDEGASADGGALLFITLIVGGMPAHARAPEDNSAAFWQVSMAVLAIQFTDFIMDDPDLYGRNVGLMDSTTLIFGTPLI